MQIDINSIIDNNLGATDGEIGKITSFYFDDDSWTIRYMVVKTGSWLFGRKVIISPDAKLKNLWEGQTVAVNLTKEKVSSIPDIGTDKPVSRQQRSRNYSIIIHGRTIGAAAFIQVVSGAPLIRHLE